MNLAEYTNTVLRLVADAMSKPRPEPEEIQFPALADAGRENSSSVRER
jgi:hypothetical protein